MEKILFSLEDWQVLPFASPLHSGLRLRPATDAANAILASDAAFDRFCREAQEFVRTASGAGSVVELELESGRRLRLPLLASVVTEASDRWFEELNDARDRCFHSNISVQAFSAEIARIACEETERAVWVVDLKTQKALLVNQAALDANQKQATDVLGDRVDALWQPQCLQALDELVERDRTVIAHANVGLRWKRASETDYTRVWHEFHCDYLAVTYLGRPCRFEMVQAAIPVTGPNGGVAIA